MDHKNIDFKSLEKYISSFCQNVSVLQETFQIDAKKDKMGQRYSAA